MDQNFSKEILQLKDLLMFDLTNKEINELLEEADILKNKLELLDKVCKKDIDFVTIPSYHCAYSLREDIPKNDLNQFYLHKNNKNINSKNLIIINRVVKK